MLADSKMDRACELAEKYKGRDSYSEIYKAIKKVSRNWNSKNIKFYWLYYQYVRWIIFYNLEMCGIMKMDTL